MIGEIERVLIDRERIARRVREMALQLCADIEKSTRRAAAAGAGSGPGSASAPGEPRVVMIAVLSGAIVFLADLIREMNLKLSLELVTVSSYPGRSTESVGPTLRGQLPGDLAGAHVVVVDDILDSGQTLGMLRRLIEAQSPASVRIAVLLRKAKPAGRAVEVPVEFAGFDIGDEFVVGYGLDYNGYYRNLPEIVTLRREVM